MTCRHRYPVAEYDSGKVYETCGNRAVWLGVDADGEETPVCDACLEAIRRNHDTLDNLVEIEA